jgi:glycosyltransferase involved in cell wall biosynthesis
MMLVPGGISFDARVQRSARSLAAHGYEVTVVARAREGERSFELDGYQVLEVPIAEREKPKEAMRRYHEAWGPLLRDQRPDVVHIHDHHGLGVAVSVLRGSARLVYDAHEYSLGKRMKPSRRVGRGAYLRANVPAVDAVVTVGDALAKTLMAELELHAPPLVLHNAPSFRDRAPAPYSLRTAIGIDRSTPLVVYAGCVTKHRRLDTVVAALARLPTAHLALILHGEPDLVALTKTSARLGIRERVHVPPAVPPDAVVSLIREADAAVHPLERYPNGDVAMPNKLFEYLHAGLPMVVSDAPQMAQFVRTHSLGEVASVEDEEAWARAIDRVLTDPAAYAGEPAARERLCHEWSWEAQEPRLLELYERLTAA